MCRRFATSFLFAAGLLAVAAAQPPGSNKKTDPNAEKVDPAPPKAKKPDPTEATVAAALRNDPDVKIAQAKVQLAEAELAKARQAVVLKAMMLVALVAEQQSAVEQHQERAAWADRMVKLGNMTPAQAQADRAKLESAKSALAKTQTELKLLTGDAVGPAGGSGDIDFTDPNQSAAQLALKWLAARQQLEQHGYASRLQLAQLAFLEARTVKGPIPDRIRAALDKPVKLGAKGEKVTFEKAVETLMKEAGLDVPVRYGTEVEEFGKFVSEGEELPLGAWLQLVEDSAVIQIQVGTGKNGSRTAKKQFRFYVRDYGLLFAATDSAPPDAPTLTEFWKPPAKKESAPEPKPK